MTNHSPPSAVPSAGIERYRWPLWWLFALLWTGALVTPVTLPHLVDAGEETQLMIKFAIAKTAHVTLYCVWTILTGWLGVAGFGRLLLLFLLLNHAVLTEFIQSFLPQRGGSLRDILLDHFGIAVGLLLSRRWWMAEK